MAFTQKKKIDFQTVILLQVPILLISLAVVFSDSLIIKDVVLEDSGNVAILNRVGAYYIWCSFCNILLDCFDN